MALLPAIVFAVLMGLTWHALTKPDVVADTSQLEKMGDAATGLAEPTESGGLGRAAVGHGPRGAACRRRNRNHLPKRRRCRAPSAAKAAPQAAKTEAAEWERVPAPTAFWIVLAVGLRGRSSCFYAVFTFVRFEIFKMLLASFFPLAVMILAVLGTIVFGLATPTEAAAVGSLGGFILAAVYALLAQPPERRARIARTWIPLWVLIGLSIVWFLLLSSRCSKVGPPVWVGWVSIVAAAIWCVAGHVRRSSCGRRSRSPCS